MFLMLALIATVIMCSIGGYAIKEGMYAGAAVGFGIGTFIVFTLGRIQGMWEMKEEIKIKLSEDGEDLF